MPAVRNRHQANGSSPSFETNKISGQEKGFSEAEARAIANKKLQYILEEQLDNQTSKLDSNKSANAYASANGKTGLNNEEVFHDTCAQPMAHSRRPARDNENTEQVLIYDGQSNTSIAQTAKDQFASALLRLQSGLDESTKRLQAVEAKVDDFIKQQQRNRQQVKPQRDNKGMGGFLTNQGSTLLYLGWPVLVFLAMRAIERRTAAAVISSSQ